jgi:hypothetical protein
VFRNPSAHEARILRAMTKEDAEDLMSLASMIHRRLDAATVRPRASARVRQPISADWRSGVCVA